MTRLRTMTRFSVAPFTGLLAMLCAGCMTPVNTAQYVTASDGTRIAVDVWLPPEAGREMQVPTIMRATRYWRAMDVKIPRYAEELDFSITEGKAWTSRGYALVLVDARGTGASFGNRVGPWSADEVADYGDVVDWIIAQPWSNGRVGAEGVSYDGNTADRIGNLEHPAVKAVAPRFSDWDAFLSPAFPGGILTDTFVGSWSRSNDALDANDVCGAFLVPEGECDEVKQIVGGVKPVDGPDGIALREQAVLEHADNVDVYAEVLAMDYRDDAFGATSLDSLSPFSHAHHAVETQTAFYAWASWMDAGTAVDALQRYATHDHPQEVLIGAWNHGGDEFADPFFPADAPGGLNFEEQMDLLETFFAPHLHGEETDAVARRIHYYTLNEGAWKETTVWPPTGLTDNMFYFQADGALTSEMPVDAAGARVYTVDFTATTGTANRWLTQNGGADVVYPDRSGEDAKLLTFTSPPLTSDLEITGHVEVVVHLATDTADGAVFAYLEDVAPDGRVTYITEGQLRLSHRALSEEAPFVVFGPYHSHERADGAPMTSGTVEEVRIGLQPTSVLIEAGHALRIALAGHDAETFEAISMDTPPTWTVQCNSVFPSGVILPMMTR